MLARQLTSKLIHRCRVAIVCPSRHTSVRTWATASRTSNPQTKKLRFKVFDEEGMSTLACLLADSSMQPGDVYFLYGEVGAGKSFFSRSFIRYAAADDRLPVPSPTYLLQQTYDFGELGEESTLLHHFDLYRLTDSNPNAWSRLDLQKCFSSSVCLVEWPERLPQHLVPESRLAVHIEVLEGPAQKADAGGEPALEETDLKEATEYQLSGHDQNAIDGDNASMYTDMRARTVTLEAHGPLWPQRLQSLKHIVVDLSKTPDFHNGTGLKLMQEHE